MAGRGVVTGSKQPPAQSGAANPAEVRRRSMMGLNGLNFFMADMFTGFGPFVSVYLTANGWLPGTIGLALSVSTVAAVAAQVPAGLLVDAVPQRRLLAALGIIAVIVSAIVLATFPDRWPVILSQVLLGVAGSLLTPTIAAITLTLSHSKQFGRRLGGNVRYKALGSMLTALSMGYIGTHISTGAVFYVSALFGCVALAFLLMISLEDIRNAPHRTQHPAALHKHVRKAPLARKRELWKDPLLLTLCGCIFMFNLSNAAVLPFAISAVEAAGLKNTDLLVSIALVVSQAMVVVVSPHLGGLAETRGRKLILLAGFVALTLRCVVLAINHGEISLVACQLLDGISAAVIGVMVPLIVSDITHRGGRFNLGLGVVSLAVAGGATVSTTIAGFITQHAGTSVAFICLGVAAAAGSLLVYGVMPETSHLHAPADAA
jgi:MFS family permease